MKPVIGILPLYDTDTDTISMRPQYMDGIRKAGGIPLILPLTDRYEEIRPLLKNCSGFLFTGGQDVSPELYGQTLFNETVVCCPRRDVMERKLLELAIEADLPVFAICRGIQIVNTVLGGTLYQDLPSQHPTTIVHRQEKPYTVPVHSAVILPDTPLADLLQTGSIRVNSMHHQAIRDLAPTLAPMAVSEDGLTEAVYRPSSRFLWAVQWHPEYLFPDDEPSRKLFARFVQACIIN